MQADGVGLARNRLALHVHVDAPRTRLGERFLVNASDTFYLGRLTTLAVSTGEGRVAADEIRVGVLFPEIAEVDENALRRILAVEVLVLEPVEPAARTRSVVVMADVLAQHATVIAESLREPARRRIEKNEIGVERRRVNEHDPRLKLGDRVRVRVDDADPRRSA